MATARAKNDAAKKLADAPEISEADVQADENADAASAKFVPTFVTELPAKPVTTRTNWWDSITPLLDANPGQWAHVYTGVGDDELKADRNALSRKVRTVRSLKEAGLDDTYLVEKRGKDIYAQRVAEDAS